MSRLSLIFISLISMFFLVACDSEVAAPPPEPSIVMDTAGPEGRISPVAAPVSDSAAIFIEPSIVPEPPGRFPSVRARARVLTAGDIDDTLNLNAFTRYVAKARKETGLPAANFRRPIRAQLVGHDGAPAPGLRVTLSKAGAAEPFYDGYAGVDGRITVFPAIYGAGNPSRVDLKVFPEDQGEVFSRQLTTGNVFSQVTVPFASGWQPEFLDLAFVVDTTGSMGDELAWLTRDLTSIVSQARRYAPGVDIRYGLIVYRDQGDAYVVRNFGFTDSKSQMRRWLRAQNADGGGDYPEAADAALQAGADLNWRRGKGERLLFHIADAPPHDNRAGAYLAAARAATQKNVQIFGLGASGVARESELLMRQAAAQSAGRYLFLTDDSGVGYSHAEPTISCYRVTALNGLMVRVLASELSGRRVEAAESDVIRSVGSYQNGICRN